MKKIIVALIAGASAVGAAQAQSAFRPYVGLGVATTDHEFRLGGVGNAESQGYKPSMKIFGGVDMTPMFGVEAGYTFLRDADYTFTVAGVPGRATSEGSRMYLAGKAGMPVNDMFTVYGKLGASYSDVKLNSATPLIGRSDSDTDWYGAIGGQFNVNERTSVILEYERYGNNEAYGPQAGAITVGARYSF